MQITKSVRRLIIASIALLVIILMLSSLRQIMSWREIFTMVITAPLLAQIAILVLSDEAQKRATELANAKREAEDKEWARQDEERKKNDSFTLEEAVKMSKELVEYKRENSLDEVAKRTFIQL